MRFLDWLYLDRHKELTCKVGGIDFKNPFGIAAGLIKYPRLLRYFAALGPGFATIGTFTPIDQKGNPSPRLFRSTRDRAIFNRLGFPNPGVEEAVLELQHLDISDFPIIGSIGANKETVDSGDIGRITNDYLLGFRTLYPHVAAIEVNVSSPNTEGLREFMRRDKLGHLLQALRAEEKGLAPNGAKKLILVKGTIDLVPEAKRIDEAPDAVIDLIRVCDEHSCGITWGNTSVSDKLKPEAFKKLGKGGTSGQTLFLHTICGIEFIREYQSKHRLPLRPLIATGGIIDAFSAFSALRAGADLCSQLTSFIYEGPSLFLREKTRLRRLMAKTGLTLRQNGNGNGSHPKRP